MRLVLAAAALAGLLSIGTVSAAPVPPGLSLPPTGAADVLPVAEGCGPGGFRDRFGRCVFRRPPPYRRFCPPRFHPTPYGCRPNY